MNLTSKFDSPFIFIYYLFHDFSIEEFSRSDEEIIPIIMGILFISFFSVVGIYVIINAIIQIYIKCCEYCDLNDEEYVYNIP